MADGVLAVDANLQIRRLNPAAADLLVLSPDRVLGRTIIEATMHHGLDELFRKALEEGRLQAQRLETIQPRRRVLQALGTPLEGDEAPTGAVAVLHDLSETDRLERTRRDFVTNVSHELRTPVASIKVMVESLQRGVLHQPELAEQFLQSIGDAADRLARLVDDVLALALERLSGGQQKMGMGDVWIPGSAGILPARSCARFHR
jgi:two-component system phosphate regulon sensor histidine kinase PhoR